MDASQLVAGTTSTDQSLLGHCYGRTGKALWQG